jgi:hypothetical protein
VPVTVLNNPSPAVNEGFGIAVAISGARVIVAAPGDGTGAPLAGSAYIFDLEGADPNIPVNTLNNPNPAANDQFGRAVALFGTWAVVGADADDAGANDAGSVYVYDLSSATPNLPAFTLNNPEPDAADNFGGTVAISATRVVVGAARDDIGATNAGSVYIYDLTAVDPTVPVLILNNPSPAPGDGFGYAVAISDTRLVVGTPYRDVGATDAGSAFLYDLAGPTPGVSVTIFSAPSPAFGNFFGRSVAISGSRVVVGADGDDTGATESGSVYVYNLAGAKPDVPLITLHNPNPSELDLFGWSVAISGTRVAVGAYGEDNGASNAGVTYIYDLAGGSPSVPMLTLTNPSPAASDSFGAAVAMAGAYVVVGALFDDLGATNAGVAYVYNVAGASPTRPILTLTNPSPAANDLFGSAVAISGMRVVVGAYQDDTVQSDAGSVYVYDLTSPTPGVPTVTLLNPSTFGAESDLFGYSVAISGTRVVVGAYRAEVGRAYVYDLASATPAVPILTLNNPTSVDGDFFGRAVSISGTRVVVGAVRSDLSNLDAGAAYLYELTSPTPTVPVATLANPSPAVGDYFGSAVAIDGDYSVVSAYNDDTNAEDRGATYVFGPPPPSLTITAATPGFVTLSWSSASPGFVLQYADRLSPASWVDAPSGAANPVTVPITSAALFYRLFKR